MGKNRETYFFPFLFVYIVIVHQNKIADRYRNSKLDLVGEWTRENERANARSIESSNTPRGSQVLCIILVPLQGTPPQKFFLKKSNFPHFFVFLGLTNGKFCVILDSSSETQNHLQAPKQQPPHRRTEKGHRGKDFDNRIHRANQNGEVCI